MSGTPRPLFVDTGGFYAAYDEHDDHHEAADAVLEAVRTGDAPYGPIYTSRYVLAELATLVLYQQNHRESVRVLEEIRSSGTINLLEVGPQEFDRACEQFARFDDHEISFVDHLSAVLADEYGIEHALAFDRDFATLGMVRVPADTGEIDRY